LVTTCVCCVFVRVFFVGVFASVFVFVCVCVYVLNVCVRVC